MCAILVVFADLNFLITCSLLLDADMVTRSPPPPYSREVEQAVPDSTTGSWDDDSWDQTTPPRSGPVRLTDRTRYPQAEEDSYRADTTSVDVDDVGKSSGQSAGGQYGGQTQSQDARR